MAANFAHDDLMFATRLAGLRPGGRRPGDLDLLAAMAGGGGGSGGGQADALVGAMVQQAMEERRMRLDSALRKSAAEEEFNRRAALEREQGDRGDTRFFAELTARKNEREGDRKYQAGEAATAFARGRKAAGEDYDRATKDADKRANMAAYDRVVEQIAAMEQQGYDPPDVLLQHRDQLASALGRSAPTTQPAGGSGGGATPKPGSPAAIRRAAERSRAIEPLQEAIAGIHLGVRQDFNKDADRGARARRPGHLVKLGRIAEQLAAVDPQGVGPTLQPIVDELLGQYEADGRNDGELLDAINQIKRLQGYEAWNPDQNPEDFDTAWKKAHPPLRSGMMPGLMP